MDQQTFLVDTRRGNYNMLNSKDVDVSVRVLRPGHKPIAFTVSENHLSELAAGDRWSEYLGGACETFLKRYISSQRQEVQALLDWAKDEANARALDTAQAEQRVAFLRRQMERTQKELAYEEQKLAVLQAEASAEAVAG